ncbi:amidohydrolase family protein [Achromobacter aloeverae]|uniref:Amidohydrolase n=1 Tax=Achromobacter aloeverae TaxID=1750518 RepID=A0A4Q1HJG2_9BURK|nr:amidohydrolase family protein [Achromobacter aloeverae]RXN87843.1 amidohydrolase [Achromobacter aloeverae]
MPSEPPSFAVPPGACDSHIHINDPRFPYLPDAELKPPPATVAQYRQVQAKLALERVVIVQPSSYGTDNRCTLDAVRQFGQARARAVVVVAPDASPALLRELHEQGARGVRLNLARGAALGSAAIADLAPRLADLGWHIQVHARAEVIADLAPMLRRQPVPVVLDHLARLRRIDGDDAAAYAAVRGLLDTGRAWIKLSGAYLDSQSGPPGYADRAPVARALLGAAPERLVWGTDWPHPSASAGERPMPDAARLLGLLADWSPDAALHRRLLVDNPLALYGFDPQPSRTTPT